MRHLDCSRCAKRLIDDFWVMVAAEPTPTFRSITLVCSCGALNRVELVPRPIRRPPPPLAPVESPLLARPA